MATPKLPRNKRVPLPLSSPDEVVCMTYCETFYDYEECRQVCLSVSQKNISLYRRLMRKAEDDGLNEEHRHIFAAGGVYTWSLLKRGELR